MNPVETFYKIDEKLNFDPEAIFLCPTESTPDMPVNHGPIVKTFWESGQKPKKSQYLPTLINKI